MTSNQRVVAVVMLSFELWFGGHESSGGIHLVEHMLSGPFPVLAETRECF